MPSSSSLSLSSPSPARIPHRGILDRCIPHRNILLLDGRFHHQNIFLLDRCVPHQTIILDGRPYLRRRVPKRGGGILNEQRRREQIIVVADHRAIVAQIGFIEGRMSLGGTGSDRVIDVAATGLGAVPGGTGPRKASNILVGVVLLLVMTDLEDRLGQVAVAVTIIAVVGFEVQGCHQGSVGLCLFEAFPPQRRLARGGRGGLDGLVRSLPGRSNGIVFGTTKADLRPFVCDRGGHHVVLCCIVLSCCFELS